jgi:N-acetylglutamate synthase-like GNAT family acetyltransferase
MIEIVEYSHKFQKEIYDLIMDIRINELGWKLPAPDLIKIEEKYQVNKGNFWVALDKGRVIGTIALEDWEEIKGFYRECI